MLKTVPAFNAALAFTHLLFLLLLGGCSSSDLITPAPTVDPQQQILFHNGVVLTMDPAAQPDANPAVTALAVTGVKISAIGRSRVTR